MKERMLPAIKALTILGIVTSILYFSGLVRDHNLSARINN